MVDALDVIIVPEASALAQLRSCVGARDVSDALAEITDAVIAHPTAAIFLTQVLRAGERVGLLEAVNIESFAFSTLLGSNEFQFWLSEVRDPKFVAPDHIANPVLIDRAVEELFIVLNRPERRNAYGRQLRDSLADALRVALIDDSVERVHLSGSGRAFSSGGEISEFGQTPDVGRAHFIRTRAGVGHLIAALGDRLTIEVHGACIGAGIEIAAFGAHVVARGSTVFKLPEVGMGLIPGAGGTASISRRIGRHRTAWLALSARTIAQDRAFEWGLVDELV
nr:enoyl-CoA hydratase/isomerase family protein [Leucobacter exalbidus]